MVCLHRSRITHDSYIKVDYFAYHLFMNRFSQFLIKTKFFEFAESNSTSYSIIP